MAGDRVHNPNDVLQLKQKKRKVVFWDLLNLVVVTREHIGLLFAPFYFTWNAFGVAAVLALLTGPVGISLCYHRNLCHNSFKLPKSLEYLFAYFGLDAVQCGNPNNVMDLQKQAYYRFLQRTHLLHLLGLAVLLYVVGGLPYLIWGMVKYMSKISAAYPLSVRIAAVHHGSFMVSSVCHKWGKRPWNTKDLSKNNWVVGYLAFGEGWHNNHHTFEFSARFGLEWWQIDVPWYIIRLLEYLGLATDVKVPTEIQKQNYSLKIHNKFL